MSERGKTAVVVGASSGLGRALATALAERGWRLVLSARDARDLEAVAADLSSRWEAQCYPLTVELANPNFDADRFCRDCERMLDATDVVFYVAGAVDDRDDGSGDDEMVRRLVEVNYVNAVRTLAAFAKVFDDRKRGVLVGFSSIAAAAPRGQNMVYASAKAGLEAYLKALRHHLADTPVLVQGYALGYLDTAMTYGRKLMLRPVSVEAVTSEVIRNLNKDRGIKYYPRYWSLITRILRLLPWFIYKRLQF